MALIDQVVVKWTGFHGEPGYSVFYVDNGPYGTRNGIASFFQMVASEFPPSVYWTIPSSGDTYDVESGDIQSTGWNVGADISHVGTAATADYAGPAGACVSWHTQTVAPPTVAGKRPHRVHGRTFMVPLTHAAFENDGTLKATTRQTLLDAANFLISTSNDHLVIWAKPMYTKTEPITQTRQGTRHTVKTASVNDVTAVLRTRRT